MSSLRKFYTDDAGYALAKQVDNDLATLFEVFSNDAANPGVVGGTAASMYEKAVIGSTGSTLYTGNSSNAADISDAGIRAMLLRLDDVDVPMDNRALVIPPVAANDMLGIARFTEQSFTSQSSITRWSSASQF